ncbi:MAG: NADH-quinone oxidoreductase subunit N [Phycisphaerae bacterium]|nr:NADH-quinone oxidoreductase subunit N [Phycisphaerae bacterium]
MVVDHYILPLLPEWILLVGTCVILLVGAGRAGQRTPAVPFLAAVVVLGALFATYRIGEPSGHAMLGLWLSPLTHYVRWITLGVGFLLVLVNWAQPVPEERGEYMGMMLFSLLGVLLTASANDYLVLFFAIELVSVPTYALIALSRLDQRASEASLKYFFLGALSAAILAYGFSFLYGVSGTTLMGHVHGGVISSTLPGSLGALGIAGLLLAIGGLAFKVAAVPFHVYAPDVYEGAASPVTGLLGFVPKLAGSVALIKLMTVCGWSLPQHVFWALWVLAVVTMTAGNVLALLQSNVKRVLGYSSIAHTGYMLVALLVGPVAGDGPMRDGVSALLFYVAVYGVMNLGAFAILAAYERGGRAMETYDDLSGLSRRAPEAALAMAICVFSLMGLPPTAGFLGKVYVFAGAFTVTSAHAHQGAMYALAIIGVLNSAIGAAYYLRIAGAAYLGPAPSQSASERITPAGGIPLRVGVAVCAVAMLFLFARPARLLRPAREATAMIQRSALAARAGVAEREARETDDARLAGAMSNH